jgi:hypothetical protein
VGDGVSWASDQRGAVKERVADLPYVVYYGAHCRRLFFGRVMSLENWRALSPRIHSEDDSARPSPAVVSVPMICGIGAVALFFSALQPSGLASWGKLFYFAMRLVLVAVVVSAIVTGVVSRIMRRRLPGSLAPIILAACMGAVWVPAWVICMRRPNVVLILADCLCMVSLNWAIKRYESEDAGPVRVPRQGPHVLRFPMGDSKPLVRTLLPALGAAVLMQAVVVAAVAENYVIAAGIGGGCCAVLVWMTDSKTLRTGVQRESNRRVAVTMGLAFLFTAVVLLPYLKRPVGGLGFTLLPKVAAAPRAAGSEHPRNSSGFTGIILLPLTKPEKKIVAPVSNEAPNAGYKLAKPMVIPFDGVYWYFKAPDTRPQVTAHLVKGSSMKAKISSTDAYPLLMDAHQELGVPINLRCCSRIEIAVQNADRRTGAIYLELWLRDKTMPGMMGRYVGTAVIPSSESGGSSDKSGSLTDETLEYALPPGMRMGKFDEITVGVRTDPMRAREGAQIGIRKFVLYP